MSPQTYRRKLDQIHSIMVELFEAGHNEPRFRRTLFHLHRARAVMQGTPLSPTDASICRFAYKSRNLIGRTVEHLIRRKSPCTATELLKELQEKHPDLLDLRYHTFYPTIRQEVYRGKRLAEFPGENGRKKYGLPHWKGALEYVPGVKHCS